MTTRPTAYCGHCNKHVEYVASTAKCKVCGRLIWELAARIHGDPLRTTSESYRTESKRE